MKIPGRPPQPIPKDLLDPRQLPGYQPSPFDIRYPHNPGKTFELESGVSGDAVRAESEYLTEWCIKMLPPQETLLAVSAGEGFGFRGMIEVRHFGDQFTEYQPAIQSNLTPLQIPVVGVCVGVHGRSIDLVVNRLAAGATGKLKLQAAIVPGRPSFSWVNRPLSVAGGLGVINIVAIPVFATRFQIFGPIDMGDVIRVCTPAGTGSVVQTVPAGGSVLAPFHPDGAFIGYSSATNKELTVGFEVIS